MVRLRVGMGDSYGLRPTVLKSDEFNPLIVTGATFMVTKPIGGGKTESVEWVGEILDQAPSSVKAAYTFNADGTDLDHPGIWRAWIQWTVPGETPGPRTEVFTFSVIAADAP